MAAAALTFEALSASIKAGNLKPVYILSGDEGYFIDELVKLFSNVLKEDEKEFNLYTLFGPQTDMNVAVDICRRYPMMADRQVVIIKEAQSTDARELDKLAKYMREPSPQTVLVVAFRGGKTKGAEMLTAAKKAGAVMFTSKPVYENQLSSLIRNYLSARGLNVQEKAADMLRDSVGANLSKLYNELDKLVGILGSGATVTPEAVEQHVGVSKDYNAFEFTDALAARDGAKAMRIAGYFRANPKAVPFPMISASVFGLFSDLLVAQSARDKSEHGLMQALGLKSPWGLKRIRLAMSRYNAWQSIEIIRAIRAYDAQSKGINSRRDPFDMLEELVFRIITAPGTLFPKY